MHDTYDDSKIRLMTWVFTTTSGGSFTHQTANELFVDSYPDFPVIVPCCDILVVNATLQHVLFVYTNITSKAVMRTMKIDPNDGDILNNNLFEAGFENNRDYYGCYSPQVLQVHDDVFAVFYVSKTHFRCQTFQMESDGAFTILDPLNVSTDSLYAPAGQFTVHVSDNIFATLIQDEGTCWLMTYRITSEGEISLYRDPFYDSFYEPIPYSYFDEATMASISTQNTIYALLGKIENDDGMIRTIQIQATHNKRLILENYWFSFTANDTVVTASVFVQTQPYVRRSFSIELPLHYSTNPDAWHYLALTYNATSLDNYPVMTFYHYYGINPDGTLQKEIQTKECTTVPPGSVLNFINYLYYNYLTIGSYNAIYDEIQIHSVTQPEGYLEDYYRSIQGP
jgi:hypothetical protein